MDDPKNGKTATAPNQRPVPPPKPSFELNRQRLDDSPTTDAPRHEPALYETVKIVQPKAVSGPVSLEDEINPQCGNSGFGDSLTSSDLYRYSSSSCDSAIASAGQSVTSESQDGSVLGSGQSMLQSRQLGSATSLVSLASSSGMGSDSEEDDLGWPSDEFSDSEYEQGLYGNQVIPDSEIVLCRFGSRCAGCSSD